MMSVGSEALDGHLHRRWLYGWVRGSATLTALPRLLIGSRAQSSRVWYRYQPYRPFSTGRRSAAHVRTERWHASSARRCTHRGNQGSQNVTLSALSVESDQTQSMMVAFHDGTTTSGVTGSNPRRNSHDAGSGIRRRETSGEVGRKVVNREVGCTTGLSPVADGRDTTFRPLVSSVRRDASLVLMDGWAGRGRWRRGYILGEAALLERFDSW